ncbi:3-oxoacyl-ACP synthase III [Gulosibacter chungangensis]|uniref:3-oxoacyl-ACP synthase III n=1 Tax=Gulosibacter chungangensis TaxID=979746 RepID=A0A7J5BG52_9MICO|nr:3-oxoacyl-ACP synthase III [Gulosibacter chungangensis]KAB1645088.1 3-oxoacyl-ACP synthase III [Gulosibacter chungangensis]
MKSGQVTSTPPQPSSNASGNSTSRHTNVALLAITETIAPVEVSSASFDERLSEALRKLGLPRNLLQRVAGVYTRRNWEKPTDYIDGAADAGRKALAESGIPADRIGLLINASVSREGLEPSVATAVHDRIGLGPQAMNFDITNACLGFVNGMTVAANMIDSGQIDYALIVAGEDMSRVQEATVQRLMREGITREEYLNEFATLTLGSGAAAAVLGRADLHPEGHRILGGVTRAATWNNHLCVGDYDGMFTDTQGLLENGMELINAAWQEANASGWDWEDMDHYIPHQVSKTHVKALTDATTIDPDKIARTYPELGNVGPASLPITLARRAPDMQPGDRVLCMGVGSGLNTAMMEIAW